MKTPSNTSLPPQAEQALKMLGQRLRTARLRRNESQEMLAKRTGISRTTQHRLENGHPGTNIGVLASTLFIYGLLDNLDGIADEDKDAVGKALEKNRLPKHARKKLTEEFNSDF